MERNEELARFLKDHETGLYRNRHGVVAYVHVPFHEIKAFMEAVGSGHFDDGGLNADIFQNSLCVELNDLFESDGETLLDYRDCFDEEEWKIYKRFIEEQCAS